MRVGLISDTHGMLRPEVFTHFADVELILHAGDVGAPDILTELAALAPVHAVFGNTDGWDLRAVVKERVVLELEGWRVLVTHGHELGSPNARRLHEAYPEADVIIYGHTHKPDSTRIGDVLVINPGAAGAGRFRIRPSLGILDLKRADQVPADEAARVLTLIGL